MEQDTLVIVCVFSAAWLVLVAAVAALLLRVASLRRRIDRLAERAGGGSQKVQLEHHAFHNPAISPGEELARRGFSMYRADDAESGRGATVDRQTGGEFVEELARELDNRQHRQEWQASQQQRLQQQPPQQDRIQQDQIQQDHSQQNRLQQDRTQDRRTLPQQQQQMHQQQWQQVQQHQQQHPPPFLLQSIEEHKKRTRSLTNPVADGGRQSDTNPNFIY